MKSRLICILFFTFIFGGKSQNLITTIAGDGTTGFYGDGGPATFSKLFFPVGIVVDDTNNVYIADLDNYRLRKVNTLNIINTVAGDGSAGSVVDGTLATNCPLFVVADVAIDSQGNIYIIDGHCIRKINTLGILTTFAGSQTNAGFSGDGGSATAALFNNPINITFDLVGNLYVNDVQNNRIRKINTSGIISTVAGNGSVGFTGDGVAATTTSLNQPQGICCDVFGNLYIADTFNQRVRKVSTSGIITTVVGTGNGGFTGDGGVASAAEIHNPWDIIFDSQNNMFISDPGNNRIRKVNGSNIINTVAGSGTSGYTGDGGPALLANISAGFLALDKLGNLYFSDNGNNVVRKIAGLGAIGIEDFEINNLSLKIYPNPSSDFLFVQVDKNSTIDKISIMDVLGNILYETQEPTIEVNNFSNGVYFAKVMSGNISGTKKFIIAK